MPDDQQSPPSRRSKNAKRRERRQRITNGDSMKDNAVDWLLVDDRSLSVDDEEEEEVQSGLGDGLLSAFASLAGSEPRQPPSVPTTSPPPKKARSRERRKKKNRDERQESSADVVGVGSPQPRARAADVGNAIMEMYGNRRRVGDGVLSEEELKAEVINLINVRLSSSFSPFFPEKAILQNDPSFMRELHKLYLRKVEV